MIETNFYQTNLLHLNQVKVAWRFHHLFQKGLQALVSQNSQLIKRKFSLLNEFYRLKVLITNNVKVITLRHKVQHIKIRCHLKHKDNRSSKMKLTIHFI